MSDQTPVPATAPVEPETPLVLTPILSYEIDIPLLNRFMLYDFTKVTPISAAIMYTVVALMSLVVNGEPLFLPPLFIGVLAAGLWVLLIISSLLLMNRWGFTNTLYEEGVGYTSGTREKSINRGLRIVGFLALLAGKPGPAGSALIASSHEDGLYEWSEIYRINAHPGPRVISLRNSWRVLYRLYCTPETYDQALAICERKVADAAAYRAANPVVKRAKPWGRWALWALLCAGAFALALSWEGARAEEIGMPVLGAAFALLLAGLFDGWFGRLCGLIALGVAGYFVYATVGEGMRPAIELFAEVGIYSPPSYADAEVPFAMSIAGGALVALAGAWRAFGPRAK
ncbi:MAG: hypothetical protein Q7W30_02555 [Coriobacteriia bacterium]|nr:hypothetical protein [Coriobacteriia bacterium]